MHNHNHRINEGVFWYWRHYSDFVDNQYFRRSKYLSTDQAFKNIRQWFDDLLYVVNVKIQQNSKHLAALSRNRFYLYAASSFFFFVCFWVDSFYNTCQSCLFNADTEYFLSGICLAACFVFLVIQKKEEEV